MLELELRPTISHEMRTRPKGLALGVGVGGGVEDVRGELAMRMSLLGLQSRIVLCNRLTEIFGIGAGSIDICIRIPVSVSCSSRKGT